MERWVGLICDASGAAVIAVRSAVDGPAALGWRRLEWDAADTQRRAATIALGEYVRTAGLRGWPVRLLFAGAGTVVQKLRLPPMKARDRFEAVRTRLVNYAAGRALLVALRTDVSLEQGEGSAAVPTLAAGVDQALVRGVVRMCRAAGLCVPSVTVLADVFGAPPDAEHCIQLIVAERTTTIQVFDGRRLMSCRDVLLGRRDFVQAYQRPILTDVGARSLAPEQAAELFDQFGIPTDTAGELTPGISAPQLWPLLNPVLQRLRQEVTQTLTQGGRSAAGELAVSVLGWPRPIGLAEYLAGELSLRLAHARVATAEHAFLAALCPPKRPGAELDLRPPEDLFVARAWRPALAAGVAAAFVLFSNSAVPRQAEAAVRALAPVSHKLAAELSAAKAQRDALEARAAAAARALGSARNLALAAPPSWPTTALLKSVLSQTPPELVMERLELRVVAKQLELSLRGQYRGATPASVVASNWCRRLSQVAPGMSARVFGVGGSGRDEPVAVDVRAVLSAGGEDSAAPGAAAP